MDKKQGSGQTFLNAIARFPELFGRKKTTEKAENGERVILNSEGGIWSSTSGFESQNAINHPLYGIAKVDLDGLSLYDYYAMKDYYQVKTSLSIIDFTLMSINWWVDGGTKEINNAVTFQLDEIWGQLMKNIAKAHWAGFSPNVKVFDLHPSKKYLYIKKLRDLSPFMCEPSLNTKDQTFNGFIQKSGTVKNWRIVNGMEVEDTEIKPASYIEPKYAFWYPFLMESGDYKGQRLLKSAYSPWFFSQIIHLYENRYFQRFSTPVTVGYAPSGYVQDSDGNQVESQEVMSKVLSEIRNNSSVSLPSERDEKGELIWDVKLLESMARGFDFEGYLKRLDMEMARAVFLPDLIFNSGRVGSYKLGQVQKDTFLMLLNALMNDLKFYVDNYIIKQFVQYNFGESAIKKGSMPTLSYEKQGTNGMTVIMELVGELARGGKIDADIEQIAKIVGVPMVRAKEPEPVVQPTKVQEPKEDKEDKSVEAMKEVSNNVMSVLGKIVEKEQNNRQTQENKSEDVDISGLVHEIIALSALQSARVSLSIENKKSDIKLGYRAKLEKLFDIEGIYDGATNIMNNILENRGNKMTSEINRDLYYALFKFYLQSINMSDDMRIELAKSLDRLADEA